MGEGFARTALVTAVLGIALFWLAPAVAEASKIDDLAYTATPGEENHLEISYDYAAQLYRFHDSGVSSIENAFGSSCTVTENTASCPMDWGGRVSVRLGDGDDSAVIANQLPHVPTPSNLWSGSVFMIGGDGNDLLDGGPGIPFDGDLLHGDYQRIAGTSLWGDGFPNDSVDVGEGNDTLIGGVGDDGFNGGPGNDVEIGKGGRDYFDGSPFIRGSGSIAIYAGGADTMVGGPGSDVFDGAEYGSPDATDQIACGSGEEGPLSSEFLPGLDMANPGDVVAVGAGDSVTSDCEAVAVIVECPDRLDSPCVGTSEVAGVAARRGAAAAAGNRGKKLVVGRERFKVPPGRPIAVRVTLRHRRMNRLLRKRQSAPLSQRAAARSGHRFVRLGGKRFVLRRG